MNLKRIAARQNVEAVLHERTSLLQLQQVIATVANEAATVEDAMQMGIDLTCAYTGWPIGHVYMVRNGSPEVLESTDIWHIENTERFKPFVEATQELQLTRGIGLPGRVLDLGKPDWIKDVSRSRIFRRAPVAKAVGIRSAFAFPVSVAKKVTAVLEFFSLEPSKPDEELLRVLQYVGTQLGRIIERRQAELILRASEEKFRSLVENVSDIITILDARGSILYQSRSIEGSFGYRPDELIGQNAFNLIHPEDLPALLELFEETCRVPGIVQSHAYRFRARDGSWHVVESTGKNLLTAQGVNGVLVYSRDITKRTLAERDLRASEERYRHLLASITDYIYQVTVHDGRVTNTKHGDACAAVTGYTSAEYEAEPLLWLGMVHGDDREAVKQQAARALAGGEPAPLEHRIIHKNGSVRWIRNTIVLRTNDQEEVVGYDGLISDITERKQVEEALRESSRRLQTVVTGAPIVLYSFDRHGVFTLSEGNGLAGLGLKPGEVVGRSLFEVYREQPEALANLRRALAGETFTVQQSFPGGARYETSHIAMRNEAGEYDGTIGVLVDVTERKRAEVALAESERKYRGLVEQSSDAILTTDEHWNIRFGNPAACEMLHCTPEELLQLNINDTYVPEERNLITRRKKEAVKGRTLHFERTVLRKDGTCFSADIVLRRMEGGLHQGIMRDITERKQVEQRLRLQNSALESAANGIAITDRQGSIIWVNPAFTGLTGYEFSEVIGKNPRILQSGAHDRAFYEFLWQTVLSGQVWRGEIVNRRKNGESYTEEMTITPLRDEHGEISHFIAIKQEITERKRAEEALQESNRRLENALADLKATQQRVIQQERLGALGTMASGIAHDFNNSLAAILGFSELMLHRPDCLHDQPRARRYMEMINTAAQDAGSVVNRLREFYRHREEGDVFAAVDVNRLVEEAASLTQPKWKAEAEARGIAIRIHADKQEVPPVSGNAAELREALTNLIFNAVDAMPKGGTITLRTRYADNQVTIEVADTGAGMPEDVRQRCLEPFFSTKGERGTGLGLSMVYGIVQRHDGTIDIQSAIGKGSTFAIHLPVQQAQTDDNDATANDPVGPRRALRVLVVDDETPVRDILSEYLKIDGHIVETAGDGMEGLQQFKRNQFDLAIVDRAMPGMNGDQVAAAIKAANAKIPLIMLTGFGSMMQAAGETPPGVDIVVSKPVTIKALRDALAQVIKN